MLRLERLFSSIPAKKSAIRTAQETRQSFLRFFENEGHTCVPSSSLIPPADDQSLLFTNAGMNQFKGMLLGVDPPDKWPSKVVTSQKCIRAGGKHNDLADVGRDLHHLSFFEMLGNWSFNGAYDKAAAIRMAWTYLTEIVGIPANRLYVSYFGGHQEWGVPEDQETAEIWRSIGVPPERILPFVEENFWEMGKSGPCGPSTEIHYDRIEGRSNVASLVNSDDSVVELWNIVFTNSIRHEDGSVSSQNVLHVDTGLGLERLVSVVQGVNSNFDIDLFQPILKKIAELSTCDAYSGKVGRADAGARDYAYRVVADHIRAATVAISDGAKPAGDNAGFVVRKMVRRAAWEADRLGVPRGSLSTLVPTVVATLESAYPALTESGSEVGKTIEEEEARFWRVCEKGKKIFDKELLKLPFGSSVLPGESIFRLHDAHGLTPDIVELWAAEKGINLDMDGYAPLKQQARKLSRASDAKRG